MIETKREFNVFKEDVESFGLEEAALVLSSIGYSITGLLNLNCDPANIRMGFYNASYSYQNFKIAEYWFSKTGIGYTSWFDKSEGNKVVSFETDRGTLFLGNINFIINSLNERVIHVLNKNITNDNSEYIDKCIEYLNYVIYFLELEKSSIETGFKYLREDRFNELIKDTDNCNCSDKFIIERKEYLNKQNR